MEITSKHRERATGLTQEPGWRLEDCRLLLTRPLRSTVAVGYLAAVERITFDEEGTHYSGDVMVEPTGDGAIILTADIEELRLDEAERLAYELLAVIDIQRADLAEGESEA